MLARQFMHNHHVLVRSLLGAFVKLRIKEQIRNPVIFTVYISAITATFILSYSMLIDGPYDTGFTAIICLLLWITVLFANYAEAIAEHRGKQQAEILRDSKKEILAKKLSKPVKESKISLVLANNLRINDLVLVEAGDFIPSDGEVVAGIASVNESAITGESAPVIRESGADRSGVTGGTQVISDWLIIRITASSGQTFLDQMIYIVENTKRHKTPNELSLSVLLISLTLVFLIVCATLLPYSIYSVESTHSGTIVDIVVLIALFVALAPTTIGGLLTTIGIAGMDRLIKANVIALSTKVVETAGDIDTLILDKTGTITLGNRQATEFLPAPGVSIDELANAAQLSSLSDETPEGRSIIILAKSKYGLRGREISGLGAKFIPFTAQTRMSGVDLPGRKIRKGSATAIEQYVQQQGGHVPKEMQNIVDDISRRGGTALLVADGSKILGTIYLKDIIKGGIKERFAQLRRMGVKTIMVTGDNQLTAAAIAAEAGVDDFLADAQPENKLELVRYLQAQGRLVAMTGDGANDSPALAQADVALAMNNGAQAAKEACNLLDLDSNPTKLIEVLEIGKQLLMTRGALTTFSLANDVSKNFAILPAAFMSTYPELEILDIMRLSSPTSAILSAIIFNAVIILLLTPLALKGVKYKGDSAEVLLKQNILLYGIGGLIVPFVCIKLIDMVLNFI